MTRFSEEDSLALSETILELQKRIKNLEEGHRSNRLSNSSLDLNSGKGYIPLIANGVEKGRIGRQPDGTVSLVFANDDDPPLTPLAPTVTPGLGNLSVRVQELTNGQPFNFSHVNVYCNGERDGTIQKLPGSWIVGPLPPEPQSIQVSSVSLAGTESPLTTPIIATPSLPTDRDFTVDPILETEIEDGAITTPKLAANAIEAGNIAAGAVTAAAIEAGAIEADKLAAEIIIATIAFIIGNPVAERLVIDSQGITQYDEQGSFTYGVGASPTSGGNFLTVVGDEGQALAAISSEGDITGQIFNVAEDITVGGQSMLDAINRLPRGIIAWGDTGTNSPSTSSIIGIMELDVQIDPTRHYRIGTNTGYLGPGGIPSTAEAETQLKWTDSGDRPTVSSVTMEISARARGFGSPMRINCTFDGARCPGGRLRLLYCIVSLTGHSVQMITPADNAFANDLQLWVEDIGPSLTQTGVFSDGGGSTTPPVSDYVREYPRTWSRSYNSAVSPKLYQGNVGYGPGRSLIGFNDAQIRADLAGSQILRVEFYLYASHWYYNSGGTVLLGTHNWSPVSSGGFSSGDWPGLNGGIEGMSSWTLPKPGGRWVDLPIAFGETLRDNVVKGLALPYGGTNLNNYGQFDEISPRLRITYRK